MAERRHEGHWRDAAAAGHTLARDAVWKDTGMHFEVEPGLKWRSTRCSPALRGARWLKVWARIPCQPLGTSPPTGVDNSHRMEVKRGLWFCHRCGRWAAAAQVSKGVLLAACQQPARAGMAVNAALAKGPVAVCNLDVLACWGAADPVPSSKGQGGSQAETKTGSVMLHCRVYSG